MSLKQQLQDDMKAAMRAKEKSRLGVIRLINAAIKQREIDERIELDDTQVLAVLEKMVKQRRDSITQYEKAERQELADVEAAEIQLIQAYLPEQLSTEEIQQLVDAAVQSTGAASMRDMGKIMGVLKPQLQGRADMSAVSKLIKDKLV
ncbi:MAG: aspartyl-tRNA amidotransferase subunit B [marine bacterium B5-7]|nr:MAG: aspartyl-tRNA amidotransferase subunit B [marine bacterium B5-7]